MANRVVLGAFDNDYRLRISSPGEDVLSVSLDNDHLVFDSSWAEVGFQLMTGTFNHNQGNGVPTTVSFGITFPFIPLVIVRMMGNNDRVLTFTGQIVSDRPFLYVENNQFRFLGSTFFTGFGGARVCHYTVYRNML